MAGKHKLHNRRISWSAFLKDVVICSLGAYGGPEAHFGVFIDQLVVKKKYLKEEEFVELIALCGILPGPTSTQTIVSIGYKLGGPLLAFFTLLIWAVPVLTVMTILSFSFVFLEALNLSQEGLRFIGPMAVGFILVAAYRIGLRVIKDRLTMILFLFGATATYFIRDPWVFPLVLLVGGAASVVESKKDELWTRATISPPWSFMVLFLFLAVGSGLALLLSENLLVELFARFYRFGYLVFGGGQVVVPIMYSDLVEAKRLMTGQEFLTGYGLVQGLPGPMFSFSAYAGGLAAREGSFLFQIAGAVVSGVGIFLPGLLLIYFVYPIWEDLKRIKAIQISLRGINAVAGGLIAAAGAVLMQSSGLTFENILVTGAASAILFFRILPAPLLVLITLLAGFLV